MRVRTVSLLSSIPMRPAAALSVALLAIASVASAPPAHAEHVAECIVTSDQQIARKPNDQTCAEVLPACPTGAAAKSAGKSFLWVLSDDQGHCMYRFMHRPGSGDDGSEVRVDDLGCRYRNSEGANAAGDGDFVHDRDDFVAPVDLGTCSNGLCTTRYCLDDASLTKCENNADCSGSRCPDPRSCVTNADCSTLSTPMLDSLAGSGTVFPVAHVPGHSCVPSWKGLATGRYLKDIQDTLGNGLRACELEVGVTDASAGGPACTSCDEKLNKNDKDFTCVRDADCGYDPILDPDGSVCENVRTFARILQEHPEQHYFTLMSGKLRDGGNGIHFLKTTIDGQPCNAFQKEEGNNVGLLAGTQCPYDANPDSCHQKIADNLRDGIVNPDDPDVPAKHNPAVMNELSPLIDFIESIPLDEDHQLERPFLIGWAPVNPHDGTHVNPPPVFRRLYFQCDPNKHPDPSCVNDTYCWNPSHYDECLVPIGGLSTDAAENLARVSMMDYMLGTLIGELDSYCVCDGGEAKSLYDMTVVTYHSDHGAFMPNSKNQVPTSNAMRGENAYRTALIVSDPAHRLDPEDPGWIKADVAADQLVQTVDVFRTMVDRFDDVPSSVPSDLKGKDLWPVLAARGITCTGNGDCAEVPDSYCAADGRCRAKPLRDVMVTQGQTNANAVPFPGWLLRPRPGTVGICVKDGWLSWNPQQPSGSSSLLFCLTNADCDTSLGFTCRREASGHAGSRTCMNWRSSAQSVFQVCGTDAHCSFENCDPNDQTACGTGTCKDAEGRYADMEGKCCEQHISNAACVPPGACAAPVLKYGVQGVVAGDGSLDVDATKFFAYDLHGDPDESLDDVTGMLGTCLKAALDRCAQQWQDWDPENSNPADDPSIECLKTENLPSECL